MTIKRVCAFSLMMAVLAACSSPASDWRTAEQLNTIEAYRGFLAKHSADIHSSEASARIARLRDDADWTQAQLASTVQGFEEYLQHEPHGAHVAAASANIVVRQRADAWEALQADLTPASLQGFLKQYPDGPEADQARDSLQRMTAFRAEFATAPSEHAAMRLRERVAREASQDPAAIVILAPDAQNSKFRVASTPMSEQQVNQLCDRITGKGGACWVVKSTG